MQRTFALFVLALVYVSQVHAALMLSNTLGNNMVLQRAPAQANIWGWADYSANVTVIFNEQNFPVIASETDGSWLVSLPATEAGGPYTIAITTDAGDKEVISNVLFGEVWICGGQSNMQFTVDCGFNATEEVAAADNYPDIRVMSVGMETYSNTPLNQLNIVQLPWSVASSKSIGMGNWTAFSAVCWFTGRNLYDQYKVPFGLISSNWGGTVVQAWSSTAALAKCNETTWGGTGVEQSSVLYNAMIYPFLNTVLAGALWYQGEQNQGDWQQYMCTFPEMIASWRQEFANHDFPFLFVQLSTPVIPEIRQSQLAALSLPNVGFATAADLGDNLSEWGNIHPRNKQTVGERLTLAARNIAYGESDVVWQGPMFQSANLTVSGSTATIAITWKLFGTGSLNIMPEPQCPSGLPAGYCENWVIGFSTGATNSVNTTTSVQDNVVTIQTQVPAQATVASVSYGWSEWPLMNIYSEQNLPAIPFSYSF